MYYYNRIYDKIKKQNIVDENNGGLLIFDIHNNDYAKINLNNPEIYTEKQYDDYTKYRYIVYNSITGGALILGQHIEMVFAIERVSKKLYLLQDSRLEEGSEPGVIYLKYCSNECIGLIQDLHFDKKLVNVGDIADIHKEFTKEAKTNSVLFAPRKKDSINKQKNEKLEEICKEMQEEIGRMLCIAPGEPALSKCIMSPIAPPETLLPIPLPSPNLPTFIE